ncbi:MULTISPECIES: aminoacyl-tRNA hydrolase [unclassified Ligilactobacillus]|uniref:aminoacyl-tRNA hydrolase n=1 Tax=unclassified Ligilactobacillus TaxID=2767920 RepID=UPI003854FCD1
MKMIVGLGNIGQQYTGTRHNVGFMVIDELAARNDVAINRVQGDALMGTAHIAGERVLLAKPTTYMNESGRAVRQLMDYYKVTRDELMIIQDDMDMELGRLRFRAKGSAGGHNGIKSIIAHVGGQDFKRLKLGIGHPTKVTVVDWVLSRFSVPERITFDETVTRAVDGLQEWILTGDFNQIMNQYNG